MKSFFFLPILIFLVIANVAGAQSYRRFVQLEWEAIKGAKTYEVELTQILPDKNEPPKKNLQLFKTKTAEWKGQLVPGKYKMRLRSKDYRGVPGEWSEASEFAVNLDKVLVKKPIADLKLQTDQEQYHKTYFEWAPVAGATAYQFELTSTDGKTKVHEDLKQNSFEISLPVAQSYQWSVTAKNEAQVFSAEPTAQAFVLLGKKLETPQISAPESSYVREVRWKKAEKNQGYDVLISKYDSKTKKLKKFKEWKSWPAEVLPFEDDWSGGVYQLNVRATAENRPASNWSRQTFQVQGGDRSPAAEYVATVRKSIERVSGWYAIASYLVTEVTYGNKSADQNTFLNLNAIGGTGRLGMGWFHPQSAWGFIGIAEFSGLTVQGTTHTYAAAELNAVYRMNVSDRAELRLQGGGFFKESPELITTATVDGHSALKVTSVGPHFGAEYWYSLSPKLGMQLHAHTYLSTFGIETPNGQELNPTLSTQLGAMASYRFTKNLTGLLGFTLREDKTSYARSSDATNTQFSNNESKITGNYLNFYAEWAF